LEAVSLPIRPIILFLFILLLLPCSASATEQHALRIGIFPLEPLNFTDKMGNPKGIYPDLLREMARAEEWQLIFVPGSWKECLERLENGSIDLLSSVARTPERELIYDYTNESVVDNWSQVFTYPGSGVESFKDLIGKRVAIVERDINGKNFLKTAKNMGIAVNVVHYATNSDTFQAVQNREVVAAVSSQHYGLRHSSDFSLVATSIQFSPFSIYFAALKDHQTDLLKHLDQHLSAWKQDKNSYYYKILQKYLGTGLIERDVFPGWLIYVISGTLGLLLLSTLWIVSLNLLVKRKTAELRESEYAYRTVANYTYNWEFWSLPDLTMQYVSPSCERITGYSADEFMNDSNLLNRIIFEADRTLWQKHIDDPENRCESLEHRIIAKDGSIKWIGHTCQSIFAPDGEYRGKRVSNRDVTSIKTVQEQLRQSQKMEAIGTLAGGIAHDFNNILSAILGYTELTLKNPDVDTKSRKNLGYVLEAAKRARDLVRQILMFSRKEEQCHLPVNFHTAVEEACTLIRKSIPTTVPLHLDIDTNTGIVMANSTQIHQVVINLCMNAYHSLSQQGGHINLKLAPVNIDTMTAANHPNLRPGKYAQLTVSDNGMGIPAETIPRIFEPFFTTKKQGEGTGMGLAIIHGIVQTHDGAIGVESLVGKGTTFKLFFPLTLQESAIDKQTTVQTAMKAQNSEHILWVDDEVMLATLGKETLEPLGYKVTTTTSALEALNLFQQAPNDYDLVVTDQAMPEMTGDVLAKRVMMIRADMPIIICTGHSALLTPKRAQAIGVKAFLMKPLDVNELNREIRKNFDNPKKHS
jgi:PAS domain S-box-containing protein